jgi:hypothetical protein
MVPIIRDFMVTKTIKDYRNIFVSNSEECYEKIAKSMGLRTLEVSNLAIVLLHIFGATRERML